MSILNRILSKLRAETQPHSRPWVRHECPTLHRAFHHVRIYLDRIHVIQQSVTLLVIPVNLWVYRNTPSAVPQPCQRFRSIGVWWKAPLRLLRPQRHVTSWLHASNTWFRCIFTIPFLHSTGRLSPNYFHGNKLWREAFTHIIFRPSSGYHRRAMPPSFQHFTKGRNVEVRAMENR